MEAAVLRRATSGATVVVLGACVAFVLAGPARATNAQFYVASGTPASVPAGSTVTFTIQNCQKNSPAACTLSSNAALGSAKLNFQAPPGFVGSATVSAPAGKTWVASATGSLIKLNAANDSSRLAAGQSFSVTVTVTKKGVYAVTTSAFYYTNFTSGPGGFSFQLKGSNPSLTITPGPLTLTFSPFVPSPGTAEVDTTLYSNPASQPPAPVTVSAVDDYGNVPDTNTPITVALAGSPDPAGGAFVGGGTRTANTNAAGVATFSDASFAIDTVAQGYALAATVGPPLTLKAPPYLSGPFNVTNDLSVCSGPTCANAATNGNGQATSTSVTSGSGSFNGELLSTSFLSDPLLAPPGACPGFNPIGNVFDVTITGGDLVASRPSFLVTFVIPANLAVPGRPAWKYNICHGAKAIVPTPAWKTKSWNFNTWPFTRKDAVDDGTGRLWGLVPLCAFAAGTDEDSLHWAQIPASNPCIVSKTKLGSGAIQLVMREPYPWDLRASTGG